MMTTFRQETLANGLCLAFRDESNRYFGDYHRVCIVVTLSFALAGLPVNSPEEVSFRTEACQKLGETLVVTRQLERMAVPTASVAQVRNNLVAGFLQHSAVYLARPAVLLSLVQAELTAQRSLRRYV